MAPLTAWAIFTVSGGSMILREPVTDREAHDLLNAMKPYHQRLHIFSGIMDASSMTKVIPIAGYPSLVIYHINYVYDEHALVLSATSMLWLNDPRVAHAGIYHHPSLSAWYFFALAHSHVSVRDVALIFSLTISPRPCTSHLIEDGAAIPPLPNPPPATRIPGVAIVGEAERRRAIAPLIHPPRMNGRILTFWLWQPLYGMVCRFRVLIDTDHKRLLVASHLLAEAIGDQTYL